MDNEQMETRGAEMFLANSTEAGLGPVARSVAERLFNGAVNARAVRLVACSDEASVRQAVRAAAQEGLPLAVVGGGHDMWGRGFVESNVVLDLAGMSRVRVDTDEATFGGGALARDLIAALPADRVAVTGTILSVGMTGLTLGGGYGTLNARFGLASDNLQRARVVLADGSVVVVSEEENADLLWALRGGGGGFGVVTEMTVATHHLPQVLTGVLFIPLPHAQAAMRLAQYVMDRHPVELSLFTGFMTGPDGAPVLFLSPLWSGSEAEGEALFEQLAGLEGAHLAGQRWLSYGESFDPEVEKAFPKGAHYHLLTRTISRLDEAAIDILIEGAGRMVSPSDAIILHDFHGAAGAVASDATAFPLRDSHFVVEIVAGWPVAGIEGAAERDWAERLCGEIERVALPGGYANLLGPHETDRVRDFYAGHVARLRAVKRRLDPHDLFRTGVGRLLD